MRALLVEDNPVLADGVGRSFAAAGLTLEHAGDLSDARAFLRDFDVDIVLLDLTLPDGDGLTLLGEIRQRGDMTPVLILTARDAVQDRVAGLDQGADDYLTKPFALDELMARARALVRRQAGNQKAEIAIGPLSIDTAARVARLDATDIDLPRREFACLSILATNANAVVSKDALISALYDNADPPAPNAIEVIISRVRKRLVHPAIELRTVRGVGYMLLEAAEAGAP
ncbi:MAG: response regulator [Alphaproteobacteria bacterium]